MYTSTRNLSIGAEGIWVGHLFVVVFTMPLFTFTLSDLQSGRQACFQISVFGRLICGGGEEERETERERERELVQGRIGMLNFWFQVYISLLFVSLLF